MIKGYAHRRIDRLAWEIAVVDDRTKIAYTLEFKAHKPVEPGLLLKEGVETTFISDDGEGREIMQGFADALNQMGFIPDDATTSELKATKYHLEDMRKLALK